MTLPVQVFLIPLARYLRSRRTSSPETPVLPSEITGGASSARFVETAQTNLPHQAAFGGDPLCDYHSLMKSFESGRHIPISEKPFKSTRGTFSPPADVKTVTDGETSADKQTEK